MLEDRGQGADRPWTKFITEGSRYLSLKLAVSLDGRIATRTGASKWITGPESRTRVQSCAPQHDAVMVGINTVLADDPRLTVRDVPGRSPVRVIVDSKLRTAAHGSQLVQTAREMPTCVVTTRERAASRRRKRSTDAGVRVVRVPRDGRRSLRRARARSASSPRARS